MQPVIPMRLRLHINSQWKQSRKVVEIMTAIDQGNAALASLGLGVKESCELLKLPNLLDEWNAHKPALLI